MPADLTGRSVLTVNMTEAHTTRMLLDSHMHVGDFPYFNVSIDHDGLVRTDVAVPAPHYVP